MELKILGSSSAGNCYLLESKNQQLILECGFSLIKIKKFLGYNFSKVVGCLISHEHGDHSKSAKKLSESGVEIIASAGTLGALKIKGSILKHLELFEIGDFRILPFNVVHDAAEPFGFLISHPEMGTLFFATDTSEIPYKFKNVNHFLLESNYEKDVLIDNVLDGKLQNFLASRIVNSHLDFDAAKEFLEKHSMVGVQNIVLIHLSERNSRGELMKAEIEKLTNVKTAIATNGVVIEINKEIF